MFLMLLFLLIPYNEASDLKVRLQRKQFGLQSPNFCNKIQGFTQKQVSLCRKFPNVTKAAMEGVAKAVNACQFEMRHERWNCSSLAVKPNNPRASAIFKKGYKETALVEALISAGAVHSIWLACLQGSEFMSCGCQGTSWKWSACSGNNKYSTESRFAARFTPQLINARDKAKDLRSNVARHNSRVGRKLILATAKRQCKCHGMSGSCVTKTCWSSPSDFKMISYELHERYKIAVSVEQANAGHQKIALQLKEHNGRRARKRQKVRSRDLVYFEESPTYCDVDPSRDSWGTDARICNKTSENNDNCEILCCGRGYDVRQQTGTESCNCRLSRSFKTICNQCPLGDVTVCKGY